MILFSTTLMIKPTLTKDKFIELAIAWNQDSQYDENRIPNIQWNGERNIRYGNENVWLDIQEYRNKNIVAIRYEKVAKDGVVWDTEYVMNFDEGKMSILLDRSYKEDALVFYKKASTPKFITKLIENDYLEMDGDLQVSDQPIYITRDNIHILPNIVNGTGKYLLPVIYVSKTKDNLDPVRVEVLARNLKGIAHIVVQSDVKLNKTCAELCNKRNEYYGGIGIYYPNVSSDHVRFLKYEEDKDGKVLFGKVMKHVLHYSSIQNIDNLYTWQGVRNALLTDKLSSQREKRLIAEDQKQKTQEEVDALLKEFDDEIENWKVQVLELTKENNKLKNETQWLYAKCSVSEKEPILYYGDEKDFYPGEIKDLLLSVLDEYVTSREKNEKGSERSRREDICYDIVKANDFQQISNKKKDSVKKALIGYKNMTSSTRKKLKELGIEVEDESKHHRLTYYGDSRYQTTISATASDSRTGDNASAAISRCMW